MLRIFARPVVPLATLVRPLSWARVPILATSLILGTGCDGGGGDGGGFPEPDVDSGDVLLDSSGSESGVETGATGINMEGLFDDEGEEATVEEEESGQGSSTPCGEAMVDVSVPAADVMLVLDKSRSMVNHSWDHDGDPATPEITRWHTLVDVVDWMTMQFDESINFGLQLFPSRDAQRTDGVEACLVAERPEVRIASRTRTKILDMLPYREARDEDSIIVGGTPAAEGMISALEHMRATNSKGARALVLVTDGAANCNMRGPNCTEDKEGVKCKRELFEVYDQRLDRVVKEAFETDAIPTYIVGIDIVDEVVGEDIDGQPEINPHEKLSEIAELGGVPNTSGDGFYNTTNEAELMAALGEIAGLLRSCIVPLDQNGNTPPTREQVPYVSFQVAGEDVPALKEGESCETNDGWRWSGREFRAVELCGSWCDSLKRVTQLDAEYGCEPPM